ncbi:uncharacterized protein LOC143298034 isoform X2 [Babylonia areolata]|uniref:uncharacterized protein LOC143298034 isoform X2 n=1 Tax=Babylonia areolata TaxID=304850 RepID=UPI003FD02EF0
MALTLARALLPLLAVSMVTIAAPLAEPAKAGEEMAAAAVNGDGEAVDRAKRAQEQIGYGNQQNSAMRGTVKKAMAMPPQEQPSPQENPQEENHVSEPEQPATVPPPAAAAADGGDGGPPEAAEESQEASKEPDQLKVAAEESAPSSEGEAATAAVSEDAQEDPQKQPDQSQAENANEPPPAPVQQQAGNEGEEQEEKKEEKEEEEEEEVEAEAPPVPVEGGEHATNGEGEEGEGQEGVVVEESQPMSLLVPVEEGGVHADSEDTSSSDTAEADIEAPPPPSTDIAAVKEDSSDDTQSPADPGTNSDSDSDSDSEQDLQTLDQAENVSEDDVENLLKDLHSNNDVPVDESGMGGEEEEEEEEEQEGDEGSAERELMQVTNQIEDGNSAADGGSGSGSGVIGEGEYAQSLLKYILSHGAEYGRLPATTTTTTNTNTNNNGYLYPADPYYRRRRSLAARARLPHIHRRRHNSHSERELSRAKRTKRDLFDDNLYYNTDRLYDLREREREEQELELEREEEEEEEEEEEAEEEAERNAEVQQLLTYLVSLYPALYDNERPSPQLPAYLWQGARYPEEEVVAEEPYWAEPTLYEEEEEEEEPQPPRVEWGEPVEQQQQQEEEVMEVPAWEPSFYPEDAALRELEEEEEEEEPEYYPAVAKREMLSFVPGQRRKRYFFPFAREPYTHWGAFVPSQQKRQQLYEEQEQEREDPYRRLRELALVLAEERQPSYLLDTLDEYKKK